MVLIAETMPIILSPEWMETSIWSKPIGTNFIVVNLICIPPLAYMCVGCNFGILSMKFGSYAIQSNQLTDPNSLCQSGRFVLTLSIALAYNFTGICGITDCAFY